VLIALRSFLDLLLESSDYVKFWAYAERKTKLRTGKGVWKRVKNIFCMVVGHGNCGYNAKAGCDVGNREARKLLGRSVRSLLSYCLSHDLPCNNPLEIDIPIV
jgi:hypothetical protein